MGYNIVKNMYSLYAEYPFYVIFFTQLRIA